ncbi:MAG: helix-turn-helix domain-containing protein [Polyangiales bacterium]
MPSRHLAPTAIAKKIAKANTIDDLVAVALLVALDTAADSNARQQLTFELGQRAIAIATEVPHVSAFNLAALERRTITRALDHVDGNVEAAADLLGMGRATLYRRVARERL